MEESQSELGQGQRLAMPILTFKRNERVVSLSGEENIIVWCAQTSDGKGVLRTFNGFTGEYMNKCKFDTVPCSAYVFKRFAQGREVPFVIVGFMNGSVTQINTQTMEMK